MFLNMLVLFITKRMEAFMFKVTYKNNGKTITKNVIDNNDLQDYPVIGQYVTDYWKGKIDNLQITNLDEGIHYDYDNIPALRRKHER